MDHWTIRIRAARDAQTRTRYAFLASIIVCVALAITILNFEFSWLRTFARPPFTEVKLGEVNEVQEEMRKELRKEWIRSSRFKIPPLGVDIESSDATILGSIGIYVLTFWFFLCIRRENHLITRLLIDADQKEDGEVKFAVYHGIASYTVFTTIGDDAPIKRLRPPPPPQEARAYDHPTFRWLVRLPAFTVLLMILTDVLSLFRDGLMRLKPTEPIWMQLQPQEWVQIGIIEFIAVGFFVAILKDCNKILECEWATEGVLREFHKVLFP